MDINQKKTNERPMTLAYWSLRGLNEPVKLFFEYLGVNYQEKKYNYSNKEEWFKQDKPQFKGTFPNLPYLIDDEGQILTESEAIIFHVAIKFDKLELVGLDQKTMKDMVRFTQIKNVVADIRTLTRGVCYNKEFYTVQETVLKEKVLTKVKMIDDMLKSQQYLYNNQLTYLDFILYETLKLVQAIGEDKAINQDYLQQYQNVLKYIRMIEEIPQIKAYLSSNRFQYWPFNGAAATWGK